MSYSDYLSTRRILSQRNVPFAEYRTEHGAGNETRTRDPNLGKVVLYQLSYSRALRQRPKPMPYERCYIFLAQHVSSSELATGDTSTERVLLL